MVFDQGSFRYSKGRGALVNETDKRAWVGGRVIGDECYDGNKGQPDIGERSITKTF